MLTATSFNDNHIDHGHDLSDHDDSDDEDGGGDDDDDDAHELCVDCDQF